jgi:hypothetical protein
MMMNINVSYPSIILKRGSIYEMIFWKPPKQRATLILEKGDHPELDTSELLDYK